MLPEETCMCDYSLHSHSCFLKAELVLRAARENIHLSYAAHRVMSPVSSRRGVSKYVTTFLATKVGFPSQTCCLDLQRHSSKNLKRSEIYTSNTRKKSVSFRTFGSFTRFRRSHQNIQAIQRQHTKTAAKVLQNQKRLEMLIMHTCLARQ